MKYSQFEDKAKRVDGILKLRLKDGSWIKLEVNPNTEEADHIFEYFFKDFGFYSIVVQWSEGIGYKLINYSTGEVTNLFGRPYFSKNGQYVISVNTDLEAGYSSNGFQLFENKHGNLIHLGNYEPNEWGPVKAKWIEENKLILENETIDFSEGKMKYLHFYIILEVKNVW